jgi:hypothetical protein
MFLPGSVFLQENLYNLQAAAHLEPSRPEFHEPTGDTYEQQEQAQNIGNEDTERNEQSLTKGGAIALRLPSTAIPISCSPFYGQAVYWKMASRKATPPPLVWLRPFLSVSSIPYILSLLFKLSMKNAVKRMQSRIQSNRMRFKRLLFIAMPISVSPYIQPRGLRLGLLQNTNNKSIPSRIFTILKPLSALNLLAPNLCYLQRAMSYVVVY